MRQIVFFMLVICHCAGFSQTKFTSVRQLLDYTSKNSISIKSNDIRLTQSKKSKLAAILNVIDPTINNSMTLTDNIKLPVSIFPSELLGGTPGTYTQVKTGVRYTNGIAHNTELKLVNLQGWENFRLAKININLTESNNRIDLKSLQENIAENYYNIVTLQEQLKSSRINEAVSDSLFRITERKFDNGLARKQDLNDAKVTYLSTKKSADEIEFLITNYTITLKILCDIPENETVVIEDTTDFLSSLPGTPLKKNVLDVENTQLKESYALSNYRQYKKEMLPTLSFVFSDSWQLYNENFNYFGGNWINSNYIGLKLSVPLPSAKTVSNAVSAKYDYELAQKNTEQAKIKSELDHRQLQNDFDKAISQYTANKEIYGLRKDSYTKNKNLYNEGILELEKTLNSYNAMVDAEYNFISSKINVVLIQSKIDINNSFN